MNTLTDRLKLVQQEEGRDTFPLISRKMSEHYGFCLVIFRKQALRGFIPSTDIAVEGDILRRYDRMGIRSGDTILSVNLGPQPLEISATLSTKDVWPRQYKLILEICVNDPVTFARLYIQESDPVARAKVAIEGSIHRAASKWDHDELTEEMLREFAVKALPVDPKTAFSLNQISLDELKAFPVDSSTSFGLKVLNVQKATLWLHPDRAKEIEIIREKDLKEQGILANGYLERVKKREEINLRTLDAQGNIDINQIVTDARRFQEEKETEHKLALEATKTRHVLDMKMYNLLEQLKQQVPIHQLEKADAEHKLRLGQKSWEDQLRRTLIEEMGKEIIPELIGRIREQIGQNKSSLREAVNEPELQYLLDILSGTSNSGMPVGQAPLSIAQNSTRVSSVSESHSPHASTSSQPNMDTHKPVQALAGVTQQKEDIIEIPDLGIRLIQATLSEEQRLRAGMSTTTGFVIFMIHEHGPAKEARLMVGDIVIELNELEPQTVQDISNAISSHETGFPVSLCVLRGEAPIEVQVNKG